MVKANKKERQGGEGSKRKWIMAEERHVHTFCSPVTSRNQLVKVIDIDSDEEGHEVVFFFVGAGLSVAALN